MFQRLFLVVVLALIGVLWIFGVALSAADTPSYVVYTVQDHETIVSIATKYQVPQDTLMRFNNLRGSDILRVGQTLLVPLIAQSSSPAETDSPPSDLSAGANTENDEPAPNANQVKGYYATIVVDKAVFRTKPNGGDVLCNNWGKRKEVLVVGQTDTHYAVLMSDGSTGWVPRLALKVSEIEIIVDRPDRKNYTPSNGHQEIVETAYEYLGIRYKLGGSLPNSVDCSLLVQTVFKRHGVSLPRTAAEQYQVGRPVGVSELLPGDRLYFYNPQHTKVGHTGIYVGGGRFIHASSNRNQVAVDDLSSPTYARKYIGACR